MPMSLLQTLLKPLAPMSHMSCARIIGAVCKPQRSVSTAHLFTNLDALEDMIQSSASNLRIGIPQRPVLVNLVLEYIWINRTDPDAVLFRQRPHLWHTFETGWEVPQNVYSHSRATSRQAMHLSGIAKFLAGGGGCGRLYELTESRPCVGKSPRGKLNLK